MVFPDMGTHISFGYVTLIPFSHAFTQWQLFDANGRQLTLGQVTMTHEQYVNWGTDDNYADDCFLENLCLTRM